MLSVFVLCGSPVIGATSHVSVASRKGKLAIFCTQSVQRAFFLANDEYACTWFVNRVENRKEIWWKRCGSGGIRTHASEETGALNQRLRPLGHATMYLSDERKLFAEPSFQMRPFLSCIHMKLCLRNPRLQLSGVHSLHYIPFRLSFYPIEFFAPQSDTGSVV